MSLSRLRVAAVAAGLVLALLLGGLATGPRAINAAVIAQTFSYSGGLQTYTVPAGVGSVTVQTIGGAGGAAFNNSTIGRGASIQGDFSVTAGAQLTVLVGGAGQGSSSEGGGGGGSFVWTGAGFAALAANPATALLVAAGGGGGAGCNGFNGVAASAASTAGSAGTGSSPGAGGTSGAGGGGGSAGFHGGGGGGGGLTGNGGIGATGNTGTGGGGGQAIVAGAAGGATGVAFGSGQNGGFGGGGGGAGAAGGGGGYSGGGGGGASTSCGGGGGGGSFNGGANQANSVAASAGNGQVVISYVSPTITTVAGGAVLLGSGGTLNDTAMLSGGANPTGTITFSLTSPSSTVVYTDVVTVSGNGTYSTALGTNPGGYLPTATGTYLWSANYSGDNVNTPAVDNGQKESEVVNSAADVAVSKSGPATVTAGQTVTYTITVSNNGPSAAQTVALSDTLPAGETFLSQSQTSGPAFTPSNTGNALGDTITTLASGASASFAVVAQVAPSVPSGSTLSNTANVSTTTTDPTPGNNGATSNAVVQTSADLSVTKAGPATANAGQNITFQITTTNNGPSDAQAAITSDTLPANTTLVSFIQNSGPPFGGLLPAGGTQTFTLVLNVNASTPNGTVLTNTANVTSTTTDPTPGNNSSSVMTTVSVPTITGCSVNPPLLPVPPDHQLHPVTITVNASGPFTLQSVTSNDPIAAGTDFTFMPGTTYAAGTTSVSGSLRAAVSPGSHARQYVLTFVPSGPAAGTACHVTVQVRLR